MSACPFPAGHWLHHHATGLACAQDSAAPAGFNDWLIPAASWPDGEVRWVPASECTVALPPAQFRKPRLVTVDGERVR